MWEDGIFVGLVDDTQVMDKDVMDPNQGMICESSRVIRESDRVIFVSESSLPMFAKHDEKPTQFGGVVPSKPASASGSRAVVRPSRVLVCGWRAEWDGAERFAFRVMEIAADLAPG